MADIRDITIGSQYTGNAALGGGNFGVAEIDTRPIQQLAYYTMLYNKAEYDQRQKDAEFTAKQLADMTAYDLNSPIEKDRNQIRKEYDALLKYVKENPSVVDYKNQEGWLEYNRRKNEFAGNLDGGKIRSIMYKVWEEKIGAEKNPEKKALLQKELNQQIEATDLRTPLKIPQEYDTSLPAIPKGQAVTFDVYRRGPNEDFKRDFSLFDAKAARAQGSLYALGLEDVPDLAGKDPATQQQILAGQERKLIEKRSNFWISGSEQFNAAIQSYKTPDGKLDESKIKGLPKDLVNLAKKTNEYLLTKAKEIESGFYTDRFGNSITFGPGMLNKDDYAPINYADGISADELAFIAQYAGWEGDKYKTTTIKTDNAIQAFQAQTGRLSVYETIRHNKAGEKLAGEQWEATKDKWQQSQTGGESVKNGAMLRAERIYNDLKKLADKNGVISPDKVRQLNSEQLKYLGVETKVGGGEGGGAERTIFVPLSFKDENGKDVDHAIQLVNGEVRVLAPKDGKITKSASGSFLGLWDNSKSSNIFNIATNILNEELKNAGAKELNSYLPIDQATGGIITTTTGGYQSQSGTTTSTQSTSNQLSVNPADWKQEGSNWRYKDGTLYDAKGNIIKNK